MDNLPPHFRIERTQHPDLNSDAPAWQLLFDGHVILWTAGDPSGLRAYATKCAAEIAVWAAMKETK